MTSSVDDMVNYREEGGGIVRSADDRAMPIEGIGNLPMTFWFSKDWVQVISAECRSCPAPGIQIYR